MQKKIDESMSYLAVYNACFSKPMNVPLRQRGSSIRNHETLKVQQAYNKSFE